MIVAELAAIFGLKIRKSEWDQAEKLISGLRRSAMSLVGILGVKSFLGMVEGAAKAGTEVLAMSKQFGISTQSVQEWGYVAKQTGSDINKFGAAISQVERNLRRFALGHGSKDVRRTFLEFGISQAEAAKMMSSPDGLNEILFRMADRAEALGVTMDTSSGIFQLAGRYAKGFAADLSQGSEKIREMMTEAKRLGLIIGQHSGAGVRCVWRDPPVHCHSRARRHSHRCSRRALAVRASRDRHRGRDPLLGRHQKRGEYGPGLD